jgi:N-methylhydantoinase B
MAMRNLQNYTPSDPVKLEVYKHFFSAIAEEMGAVLRKASFSPNIKERRDYSCAIFDAHSSMIAQAAHIPVHLGSMPLSVKSAISKFTRQGEHLLPGDTVILNDPFLGGTHFNHPGDTVFINDAFTLAVASRAHVPISERLLRIVHRVKSTGSFSFPRQTCQCG